nr:MAG TPA: tail protein [Caudoviricetes sp.]
MIKLTPQKRGFLSIAPTGGAFNAITKIIGAILNPILKLFLPNTSSAANIKNSRSASSNNSLQGRSPCLPKKCIHGGCVTGQLM